MAIPFIDFVDLALREALNSLQARSPFVVGIARKLIVDSLGDDAVLVWVILDDNTPPSERTADRLQQIAEIVTERVAAHGLLVQPYVHFRLKSEHEALAKAG